MNTVSPNVTPDTRSSLETASSAHAVVHVTVSSTPDLRPEITGHDARKIYAAGLWSLFASFARNPATPALEDAESRSKVPTTSLWYDGCEAEPAQRSTLKDKRTQRSA